MKGFLNPAHAKIMKWSSLRAVNLGRVINTLCNEHNEQTSCVEAKPHGRQLSASLEAGSSEIDVVASQEVHTAAIRGSRSRVRINTLSVCPLSVGWL